MTMTSDPRRVPYDPRRASLYHPGDAEDFFTRPGTWSDAALCAELSRLSYCDAAARRRGSLARVGLEEHDFLDLEKTQVLIAAGPRQVFVAFRGTDDPKALRNDLTALPIPWEKGGRVHKGFADYLKPVRARLTAIIEGFAGHELVFTGHSLGAAAATLAEGLWPRGALYTFGSPLVGDAVFAGTLPRDRIQRFVDCCDVVCRVPPGGLGYVHVGTLHYIDRNGGVSTGRPAEEIKADQRAGRWAYLRRYAWGFWRNVLVRDLADHAPINYVAAA